MAKMTRLLNLTAALINASVPMTAEELRQKVDGYPDSDVAFHRAFERDKDDLRELGVPLDTVTVEHHEIPKAAYNIDRARYALRNPGFSPEELAALQLARTAVMFEGLEADEIQDTFRKLGGIKAESSGSGALGSIPLSDDLAVIFGAINERRLLEFDYTDERRTVEPTSLQFVRGRWYLSAFDRGRDGVRNFRTDRIDGELTAGEPGSFTPRSTDSELVTSPWATGDLDAVRTLVIIDQEPAQATLSEYPDLVVSEELEDASVVVEIPVRNQAGFFGFMAGLLDKAEIVEPSSLRDGYIAWLSERLVLPATQSVLTTPVLPTHPVDQPPTPTRTTPNRVSAVERVQRVLAILPWIVANQGCTVDEVSRRFAISRKELLKDLDDVFQYVGVHPFTPDCLSDVFIDEESDVISVSLGDYFAKPPRLSPAEALSLLTAAKAALRLDYRFSDDDSFYEAQRAEDANDILRTAVNKLELSLGLASSGSVDVRIAEIDTELSASLREAVANRHKLEISYYSFGQDRLSDRVVEPWSLVNHHGHWYLRAWCTTAEGQREFRLDRIYMVTELDEGFETRPEECAGAWSFSTRSATVELTGAQEIEWVARSYPVDSVEQLESGDIRVMLPIAARHWLERLTLRLPADVTIRDADSGEDLSAMRVQTARRVLERYGVV